MQVHYLYACWCLGGPGSCSPANCLFTLSGSVPLQSANLSSVQVAQAFRKEASIYFPHNLDFRGRAYPMHPHLNHLGGDVNRGLLQFADAKPLGPSGLKWLKVSVSADSHCVSVVLLLMLTATHQQAKGTWGISMQPDV